MENELTELEKELVLIATSVLASFEKQEEIDNTIETLLKRGDEILSKINHCECDEDNTDDECDEDCCCNDDNVEEYCKNRDKIEDKKYCLNLIYNNIINTSSTSNLAYDKYNVDYVIATAEKLYNYLIK